MSVSLDKALDLADFASGLFRESFSKDANACSMNQKQGDNSNMESLHPYSEPGS